jgi:hypothetical protein
MNDSLLETIQTIQQRAERLEQDAAELRQELARVADALISPSSVVARYVIEDETYEITQADVESVKIELAKPWSNNALYELAAVKKMAKKLKECSPEEQNRRFFKTVEAIRAAALADGTAVDTEAETAVDD